MAKYDLTLTNSNTETVEADTFITTEAWIDFLNVHREVTLRVRASDVYRIKRNDG